MSKQHHNVKVLRQYNKWRRGKHDNQPNPTELGNVIDWAIRVCEAADKLVNGKGRHHSEVAYRRLEESVNGTSKETTT